MPESLLEQLKQIGGQSLDARFEHLQQLNVVQPQNSLAFNCRGCGEKCCTTDTPIVLSIPEVWRMTWQILRIPGMAAFFNRLGIGAIYIYLAIPRDCPCKH